MYECFQIFYSNALVCLILRNVIFTSAACFIVTERLNVGISQIKQVLAAKFTAENHENQEELTKHIEKAVKTATSKQAS